jgi:hypothetical protein
MLVIYGGVSPSCGDYCYDVWIWDFCKFSNRSGLYAFFFSQNFVWFSYSNMVFGILFCFGPAEWCRQSRSWTSQVTLIRFYFSFKTCFYLVYAHSRWNAGSLVYDNQMVVVHGHRMHKFLDDIWSFDAGAFSSFETST